MDLIKQLVYFQQLREDIDNLSNDEYTIYAASGPDSDKVYYGYCKGISDEAMRSAFTTQAERGGPEEKRGARYLATENGGIDNLEFEPVDFAKDEVDAHHLRDKFRSENKEASITGPSPFPPRIWRAAQERHADYYAQQREKAADEKREDQKRHALTRASNKFGTARQAYAAGWFNPQQIKSLAKNPEAKTDLDVLTPLQFAHKYDVQFTQPTQAA